MIVIPVRATYLEEFAYDSGEEGERRNNRVILFNFSPISIGFYNFYTRSVSIKRSLTTTFYA